MSVATGESKSSVLFDGGAESGSSDLHEDHHTKRRLLSRIFVSENGWKRQLVRLGVIAGGIVLSASATKAAYNTYQDDQATLRQNEADEATRIAKEIAASGGGKNPLSIASGPIEVTEGVVVRETCVIKNNHYFLHKSNEHTTVGQGQKLTIDSPQRVIVDGALFYSFRLDNEPKPSATTEGPTSASIAAKTYCIAASSLIVQQNHSSSASEPLITRLEPQSGLPEDQEAERIVTGKRLPDGSIVTADGDIAGVGRIDQATAADFYQNAYNYGSAG